MDVNTQVTLQLLRKLLQAHSEKEILESVMQAGEEFMGASGVSFIPYDEWGQSLPVLMHGKVPGQTPQSWPQRLSLPETRQICKNCKVLHGDSGCVLFLSATALPIEVFCFSLNSAGREVGIFNFYFNNDVVLNTETNAFVSDILDVSGQAIENLHRRDREIAALHYLQTFISPISELSKLLNSLLENVQQALEVEFAMLYFPSGIPGQLNLQRYSLNPQIFSHTKEKANPSSVIPDLLFLEDIWNKVLDSGHSLSLENVVLNKLDSWQAVLIVPLVWHDEEPIGALILGSSSNQMLNKRHQALLETLAGQTVLLIQNAQRMVQVEYQAVVDERTRLAREIHDGLAQTLAFLKIQATQMQKFLARGETEKLTNTLQANYRTISDAYIDARQAIDNLRRVPSTNLRDWISQVAADYERTVFANQKVNVSIAEFSSEYPDNVQVQLIRIVQEALSNVRKHAAASNVDIVGIQTQDSYMIEICDNGLGFNPLTENIEGNLHYGLRGMRERSESIGIDFQIISQPEKGTCVSLRIPVAVREET